MPSGGEPPAAEPAGSVAGVEDAYKAHSALLRDIAEKKFNIPAGDAESVVSEVFTAYLVRRDQVRDARKWLIGAVCHASRAYWRVATKTAPLPSDVAEYTDPRSAGLEGRILDRVTMAAALNLVGPKCRETLRLYYAEGYSAAEIAEHYGTTTGYVMQLLHACRNRMRKAYDELRKDKG
ncbi:MAG: sigma-70 family RNA polymerase sigma factor [Acidobacteria bacterium]|nr:sigma-70 family RNA polymerase sigma factor [Acidobacteriota bacterium]MBV9478801.1 sigma-70 family RNA polymerase sigma factor [Acidobacteriota bacterium]